MRYHASNQVRMIDGLPASLAVSFDTNVFEYMLYELCRHTAVEEGGKYIGYVGESQSAGICELKITDFLPGGPKAKRTAVEFMPDGEYQDRLYRKAEQRDPAVEHVGTWHSHHCNGLTTLSDGDIRGYFKTVNKPAYRPQLFVASLVKDLPTNSDDRAWIDHFLFVKGEHERFYRITDHVRLIDNPSSFTDITGHRRPSAVTPDRSIFWYETEQGRVTLAEDQKLFRGDLGLSTRATRKNGTISITCQLDSRFMCVSYPEQPTDDLIHIEVGANSHRLISIQCSLSDRKIGFAAGLHAFATASN